MLLKCFSYAIFIFLYVSQSQAGFWQDTGREFASPVTTDAKYVFWSGSLLTSILVIDGIEDSLGHDIQDEAVDEKPLGSFSRFGDLAGQMVPNAAYVLGAYGAGYFFDNPSYNSKAMHMIKSTLYAGLVTTVLKHVVREPRPSRTSDSRLSFPSGHSTTAFAFAAVVGTEHEWYWAVPAYTLAGFVAFSRINDNAHRLHDVVAGAVIGTSYGLGIHYLYKKQDNPLSKVSVVPIYDGLMVNVKFGI